MAREPRTLDEHLALEYSFHVLADPEGGYVIEFPDLPGCLTQVDDLGEVGSVAEEIRTLWIETEYTEGREIPPPFTPSSYSGKFNVRLPRALHRRLSHSADREGISLNQYVVSILSAGDVEGRLEKWLEGLEKRLEALRSGSSNRPSRPTGPPRIKAPKGVKSHASARTRS
jgi:predicted RNase H-like HicB family nuclease